jgi:hypothetical protein
VATYQSTQASVTKFQASAERQTLGIQIGNDKKSPSLLNSQQKQIVDDVDINPDALKKLEEAQVLARQLQEYLAYLKGREDKPAPQLSKPEAEASAVIQGRSTKLAASVTVAQYKEETLKITADFDDEGSLTSLTIDKREVTAEYVRADLLLEDRQFFAHV